MRRISVLLLAGLAFLAACSHGEKPPTGRWIGQIDSADVMVDARLEILADGTVKLSAPDILGAGELSDDERTMLHNRVAEQLEASWSKAPVRRMDFDGKVFRKPGGVAPQMEWNPQTHEMKVVFYFGMQRSIRISMIRVSDFSSDPWRSGT
ncbi:MAG: hypothetical protein WCD42_01015 [Rhizomicrobium sp.]